MQWSTMAIVLMVDSINCCNKTSHVQTHGYCLFVWCLTARQHTIGQFVPTAGGWNRLRWLRMANETQCIILNTFTIWLLYYTAFHTTFSHLLVTTAYSHSHQRHPPFSYYNAQSFTSNASPCTVIKYTEVQEILKFLYWNTRKLNQDSKQNK